MKEDCVQTTHRDNSKVTANLNVHHEDPVSTENFIKPTSVKELSAKTLITAKIKKCQKDSRS